jgi:hypothetical protein
VPILQLYMCKEVLDSRIHIYVPSSPGNTGRNRKYELNSHVLNLTTLAFGQSSCAVVAAVKWNCPVTPGIRLPEKQAEFSPLIINAVSLYYNCKEQDMVGARDSITGSASVRRHRSMTAAMRLPLAMAGLTLMCSNAIFELEKRARHYSVG